MAIHAHAGLEDEYRLLVEGAAALERDRLVIEVTGPDTVEFLQGQVTNDVAALQPGEGCYALLLNPKGRILADMRILMPADGELWLDGDPAPMEVVESNLRMYRIGRRVEISRGNTPDDHRLISIIGPAAREVLRIDPPRREHASIRVELNGATATAVSTDIGVDLLFAGSDGAVVEQALAGVPTVSESTAEILRIERGRPRHGIDMSEENLPGELGLEERAISFTKGCYVGQEPVARMYHRGHPNRHLRGLELSQPARSGDPVANRNGGGATEVGKVGSTAVSPAFGPIALSVLRREVEPGAEVSVGDAPARVVALPFARG
jgi:folate-binding protein YgfZ